MHPLVGFRIQAYTGDTTINGLNMKKVGNHILYQEAYQIYYWSNNALRLIYDFDVSPGDTATFEMPVCGGGIISSQYVIEEVDSILINNHALKRIKSKSVEGSYPFSYEYIERIGSIGKIVEEVCIFIPEFVPPWLRCYEDNEISYQTDRFLSFGEEECNIVIKLSSILSLAEENKIKFFPNPAGERITILIDNDYFISGRYYVTIVNIAGENILTQRLFSHKTKLSIADASYGMYFIFIFDALDKQNLRRSKLVIY